MKFDLCDHIFNSAEEFVGFVVAQLSNPNLLRSHKQKPEVKCKVCSRVFSLTVCFSLDRSCRKHAEGFSAPCGSAARSVDLLSCATVSL